MNTTTTTFQQPTSTPTPIKAEVKQAMIDYIMDTDRVLPFDLGLVVEILYRESVGQPVKHLYKPTPAVWSLMSAEAAAWAGLSRRDPYVDVQKYPDSKNMSEIRHTFSTVIYSDGIHRANRLSPDFRKKLADIVRTMPEVR
jgi:hypothetical protein